MEGQQGERPTQPSAQTDARGNQAVRPPTTRRHGVVTFAAVWCLSPHFTESWDPEMEPIRIDRTNSKRYHVDGYILACWGKRKASLEARGQHVLELGHHDKPTW